jgi:hypothetical protein
MVAWARGREGACDLVHGRMRARRIVPMPAPRLAGVSCLQGRPCGLAGVRRTHAAWASVPAPRTRPGNRFAGQQGQRGVASARRSAPNIHYVNIAPCNNARGINGLGGIVHVASHGMGIAIRIRAHRVRHAHGRVGAWARSARTWRMGAQAPVRASGRGWWRSGRYPSPLRTYTPM